MTGINNAADILLPGRRVGADDALQLPVRGIFPHPHSLAG